MKRIFCYITYAVMAWMSNAAYADNSNTAPNPIVETKDNLVKPLIVERADSALVAQSKNTHKPIKIISKSTNPNIPTVVEVDKSKAVGKIDIISGVSSSGAKTYEIPLRVAEESHGMPLNLSLQYNSFQGNSIVGLGWSLEGCPMIARISKSIRNDGQVAPVLGNKDDAFALDGMRLIKIKDVAGGIVYQSEQGNIKVIGRIEGNDIDSFEVHYPDGRKGVFPGYGRNSVKSYFPISEMSDLYGNKIEFKYYLSPFEIYKITYGENTIEFLYRTRPDKLVNYSCGMDNSESRLLYGITTKCNNLDTGYYTLIYNHQHKISKLISLEYQVGTESFNPLMFYYGTGQDYLSFDTSSTQLLEWFKVDRLSDQKAVVGRFDYETGDEGIIIYPNRNPYKEISYEQGQYSNEYDEIGDEKILLYAGLSADYPDPYPDLMTEKGFVDILCADIYGNQQECIVKINNVVEDGWDCVKFHIYGKDTYTGIRSLGTKTFYFNTLYNESSPEPCVCPKTFYPGDFDGDGKIEILMFCDNNDYNVFDAGLSTCIFDLAEGEVKYDDYFIDVNIKRIGDINTDARKAYNESDRIMIMDFDGDGKTDFCYLNDRSLDVFSFDVKPNGLKARLVYSDKSIAKKDFENRDIIVGDLNGDGLMDFAVTPDATVRKDDVWYFNYSRGDGSFYEKPMPLTVNDVNVELGDRETYGGFFMKDVNGDGKSDIVKFNSQTFTCFYVDPIGGSFLHREEQMPSSQSMLIPLNINSHNMGTSLSSIHLGTVTKYSTLDVGKESLLTGMVESTGVVEVNEYSEILQQTSDIDNDTQVFYKKGNDAKYPYVNINESISVLASSHKTMGGEYITEDKYSYTNAVLHRHGLGFCGFETVTQQDIAGNKTVMTYEPYNYGMLCKCETPANITTQTNSSAINMSGTLILFVNSKKEENLLTGITTETTYEYDQYGNVTDEFSIVGREYIVEKKSGYVSRPVDGDGYYIGFKTKEEITKTIDINSVTESTIITNYIKCRPLKVEKRINDNLVSQSLYRYTTSGNLLWESTLPYDAEYALETNYEYDEKGRLSSVIDPLGLTETYEYDNYGRLSKKTNRQYNVTTYGYDDFGRLTGTKLSDGSEQHVSYQWNSDYENGLYDEITESSSKPTTIRTYDPLGRVVREGDTRFDGRIRYRETIYDIFGNITKQSLPYISGEKKLWNFNEYDRYNRIIYAEQASGKYESYSYDGKSITTYTNGIPVTRDYDARGNVIAVTDVAGTISYTIDADGQMLSTHAPGTTESISTGYDKYRRRISLYDPSLGLTRWTYNDRGDIASVSYSNGKSISYEYDSFGRVVKEVSPESTTTYKYDIYGDLSEKVSDNGTEIILNHDMHGRVISSYEGSLDGNWLCKDFSYNKGQLKATYYSYNDKEISEHYRYDNGHLVETTLYDGRSIFKLLRENDLGQPIEVTTGPITRKYEFDEFGMPSRRHAASAKTTYQELNYYFEEETSNLLWRDNGALLEDFEYDELDRLTSYNGKHVGYDEKGNIVGKSDAGAFKYTHSLKPYVITEASIYSESIIPSDTQTIQYTSSGRPATITEAGLTASFTYNPERERSRMRIQTSTLGDILTRYYMGGCLELDTRYNKSFEKLYLMGDYYTSPVVWINDDDGSRFGFVLRDYLGSITHVVAQNGEILEEAYYDAWGRPSDPVSGKAYNYKDAPYPYLGRGFTGHEHLPMFGLINMNARLYDPVLGRFLSPDPYVQNPESSQNFNRFSYALNNPLKYTDPSGEFIIAYLFTKFVINNAKMLTSVGFAASFDLFKNVTSHGLNVNSYDWLKTRNSWKLYDGMYRGSVGQVLNKWTWGISNSCLGYWMAQGYNMFGNAGAVTNLDGAVALSNTTSGGAAVTVGHYTMGPENYKADYHDNLFVHEYGHYIQAQRMGGMYLRVIGIPSLLSAMGTSAWVGTTHSQRWFEVSASKFGAKHFNKYYGPGTGIKYPFEIDQFFGDGYSTYINPRTNNTDKSNSKFNQGSHEPAHYSGFYFWDLIGLFL